MTALIPMLSSGMLTLVTFLVIVAFIAWGVTSLRGHVGKVSAPHESDLSEQGRRAEAFEHQFVSHREVAEQPLRGESPEEALRQQRLHEAEERD